MTAKQNPGLQSPDGSYYITLTDGNGNLVTTTPFRTSTFSGLPAAANNTNVIYKVTDIGVNGSQWISNGTKWAPLNGSTVLVQNGMPFVVLSSGSVSAGGAISGITALPATYPKAWCYFPANVLATTITAGWYYCTFSTSTAGTAFLNTPGASFPIIWPASPTVVTDGKGAYTGFSNGFAQVVLPTVTVAGNAMGINGQLVGRVSVTETSNGNSKLIGFNFGGGGGGSANEFAQGALTGEVEIVATVANAGNAGVQSQTLGGIAAGQATNPHAIHTATDTTANQTIGFTTSNNTATDNVVFENFTITLYNDGQ